MSYISQILIDLNPVSDLTLNKSKIIDIFISNFLWDLN